MVFRIDEFLAGYFAGACGLLVGYPLDTIKTIQQATNQNVKRASYEIFLSNKGILGFYRGLSMPLLTTGFINSILFGVYGNSFRFLQNHCKTNEERKKLYGFHIFISGCLGGFVQSTINCPFELVKIRRQTGACFAEGSSFRCFLMILNKDGFRGLYRGYSPLLLRDVVPCGIYMSVYDYVFNYLNNFKQINERNHNFSLSTKAGAIAGVISWIFVIPFDVIKTILQAETKISIYKNWYHCVTENVKYNGWIYLFRGSWLLIFRAIPVNASIFFSYEWFLEQMDKFK